MADCSEFPIQLANTGIAAEIHDETLGFDFDDFESAWEVLAGVTTANLGNEASTQAHKFNSKKIIWDGPMLLDILATRRKLLSAVVARNLRIG